MPTPLFFLCACCGAIPSGDAVKRQSHLPVLQVSSCVVVQQLVAGVAIGSGARLLLLPDGHRQRRQADVDVLEGMQQEDAHNDCDKATECTNDIVRAHVLPLLEKYGRAREHWCSEEHIVDGRHQWRVKDVQRLVQVVDLCADTGHQTQQ